MTITKAEIDLNIGIDDECPICAQNLPFNTTVRAAIEEGDAIFFGKKPVKWYSSIEEGLQDLEK
jgi:hypothetical protein